MVIHNFFQYEGAKGVPEILEASKYFVQILCNEYGSERDYKSEGGFVVIIQDKEDYDILETYNVDLNTQIVEWTDVIETAQGKWINSLLMIGDDYAIVIFMKYEDATDNLISYIEEPIS